VINLWRYFEGPPPHEQANADFSSNRFEDHMHIFKSAKSIITTCFAVALVGNSAVCQTNQASKTPAFKIEALPDQLARRVQSQKDMFRQFGLTDPDKTSKGVINALKIWTTEYPQVKVCFFTGSKALRARIAKIAMEWKSAVPGAPLDFGNLADPRLCKSGEVNQIRVGFAFTGYWSLVGQDSVKLPGPDEQSMNFEGFDTSPPDDDEFHATVLHEFGHALGLEHEHQNPLAKCKDEFDWKKIYAWLAGPPNNWSKETTDFNMGVLNDPGLLVTSFDKKSIMLYTFPREYFKQDAKASCYSAPNRVLSEGDKNIVAALYPADKSEKIKLQNEIKKGHLDAINISGKSDGAKSGVIQTLDDYIP
jgi:hypothetical protein